MRKKSIKDMMSLVPFGRMNAVSKPELAMMMGINVRSVRRTAEECRAEGLIIISNTDIEGYFQPTRDSDGLYAARVFLAEQRSRIEKIQIGIDAVARWILELEAEGMQGGDLDDAA